MGLVEIDDGYDFKVVIVDDRWVFRFPRRPQVLAALEREIAILPELASALPVAVPTFELVSREPPFVVYPLLRGAPLVDEDPDGVRAFLDTLHSIAPPLPVEDWLGAYGEQCEEFGRRVLPLLSPEEQIRAWAFFEEAETLSGFEPALVHGDLLPEHLLVLDGRLHAVIDWGDARVGDPALDYAWLLNGPFPGWEVEPDLRRRARFYHRLAPWYEAHYGLVTEQPTSVERGLADIRSQLS